MSAPTVDDRTRQLVAQIAANLQVRFVFVANEASIRGVDAGALGADSALAFQAVICLTNAGSERIPGPQEVPWAIRLSTIRRILAVAEPFRAEPVTGDLVDLRPAPDFAGLAAGETIELPVVMEYWMCYLSDVMPRWYVHAPNAAPKVIASTDTEQIGAFVSGMDEESRKRHRWDRSVYMNPVNRYDLMAGIPQPAAEPTRIVPQADEVTPLGDWVDLRAGITLDLPLPDAASAALKEAAATLGVGVGSYPISGRKVDLGQAPAGSYKLTVAEEGASAEAADESGLANAVRTLLALLDPSTGKVPTVQITDGPRFGYRGVMVDIARNMLSMETLRRLLEAMASYKLNVLHLHLTDDEGWRLEIPGLPELTEVGGRRGHTEDESDMLLPALGSGPNNDTSGTGWLTRDDYVDLLRYAAARYIEIIPEVDMPAHSRAAIVSMEARYRNVLAKGGSEEAASAYRLLHPQDTTRLTTIQYYDRRSTLDPALPSTSRFLDHVMGQIAQMHSEAGTPLRAWHYGGDEASNVLLGSGFSDLSDPVEGTGVIDRSAQDEPWSGSPAVQAAIARGDLSDTHAIPAWFAVHVARLADRHGIGTLQAWQDGLRHARSAADFPIPTRVNLWDTMAWGVCSALPDEQAKGYEVVLTIPDFLYLDFPSEINIHERGYYWGMRAVDYWRAFAWAPGNLPMNAELHPDRDGWSLSTVASAPVGPNYGISAAVFGEMLRTDEQFVSQVFPRLLAVAERAWHTPAWELPYEVGMEFEAGRTQRVDLPAVRADLGGHLAVVREREIARLEAMGIGYQVGPPAAVISDGVLHTRSWFGLPCQFSLDGGLTWEDASRAVPVAQDSVLVRCTSRDGQRTSRVEEVRAT